MKASAQMHIQVFACSQMDVCRMRECSTNVSLCVKRCLVSEIHQIEVAYSACTYVQTYVCLNIIINTCIKCQIDTLYIYACINQDTHTLQHCTCILCFGCKFCFFTVFYVKVACWLVYVATIHQVLSQMQLNHSTSRSETISGTKLKAKIPKLK